MTEYGAYIHEDVLSTVVSVRVPKTSTSHSTSSMHTVTYIQCCCPRVFVLRHLEITYRWSWSWGLQYWSWSWSWSWSWGALRSLTGGPGLEGCGLGLGLDNSGLGLGLEVPWDHLQVVLVLRAAVLVLAIMVLVLVLKLHRWMKKVLWRNENTVHWL